jgi:hypothetical protein
MREDCIVVEGKTESQPRYNDVSIYMGSRTLDLTRYTLDFLYEISSFMFWIRRYKCKVIMGQYLTPTRRKYTETFLLLALFFKGSPGPGVH